MAIRASLKGGDEIMKVYATGFSVEQKEDKSPLTLADKNAHHAIAEILKGTGIPVLSEEGKEIPFEERKDWKRLWIVDPLDGTKEFVKRNGEFTVNIALVEDHLPVLGVIYVPVTKTLYYAANGTGAFVKLNIQHSPFTIQQLVSASKQLPQQKPGSKFSIVASRSHFTKETEDYINEMKSKHGEVEIVSSGSSLKICLVAEGIADVYPRFGPTMEWDTAAGQAIAQCAGKNLIDYETKKPMLYNRENLRNGWFVVE